MSGYDRHPDYGGPPPTRREIFVTIIVWHALAAAWFWWAS